MPRSVLFLTLLLRTAHPADAGEPPSPPAAVSPGHPSRMLAIADRCPTFSWGGTAGAEQVELVVYRLDRENAGPTVALRASIDGRASSWTPTLDRCLQWGDSYGWVLRALWAGSASRWSPPALFRVVGGPVVIGTDPPSAASRPPAERPNAATAGSSAPGSVDDESDGAPRPPEASTPGTAASGLSLSVEGGVGATYFHGDGAALSNVQASGLSCAQCVTAGALADGSVTAAKIGEACAPGEVLMRGAAAWSCAAPAAPGCTPGDQVACYTGPEATRGVGPCQSGSRTCQTNASWGSCTGEVTPLPESCDGVDNDCDQSPDDGEAAALCPPTQNVAATSCVEAACAVIDCSPLWSDADGDYANGCEAPAPGACLDGGSPRAIAPPSPGDLFVQELMADPTAPLTDAAAEWFEVRAAAAVDLNDLTIGTVPGSPVDQIQSDDCLAVAPGDLLLFARSADPAVNGGLSPDQTFSFSLVNGGGDLHLAHGGTLVDAVSWGAGEVAAGRSRNLPAAFQNASDNDDPAHWCTVPADPLLLYTEGNHGTPGLANVACP